MGNGEVKGFGREFLEGGDRWQGLEGEVAIEAGTACITGGVRRRC